MQASSDINNKRKIKDGVLHFFPLNEIKENQSNNNKKNGFWPNKQRLHVWLVLLDDNNSVVSFTENTHEDWTKPKPTL